MPPHSGPSTSSSRAHAPMINRLGPVAPGEAVDQRGRQLIAGYGVKRVSASLSPRDRRESGRAVPRGAHRARSALSASTGESTVATREARETLGLPGRNGEAPSDRSLGASVYRPSPLLGATRNWLPNSSGSKNFATCAVVDFAAARKRAKQRAAGLRLDPRERAVEWMRQLQAGEVASRAALARREGLSRARVSQVLNQIRSVVAHRQRAG